MVDRFSAFIQKNKLLSAEDHVLIAVSGGVDSVVLAHMIAELKVTFSIAHCNFQLRGSDSDEDEQFVLELAKRHNATCYVKKFETKAFAKTQGISTQMAARDLRYDWFRELMSTNNLHKLATAHHGSDQVETILFNLTKGTGIAGLRGIPVRNESIIRPLLFASKEEIQTYAEQNGLSWREDSSNASTDYQRNLIRHEVVPHLQKINPGLISTSLRNGQRFSSIEQFVLDEAKKIEEQHLSTKNGIVTLRLDWIAFYSQPGVLLEILLKPYGFSYFQVADLLNDKVLQSGKTFISDQYELVVDRQRLVITRSGERNDVHMVINEDDNSVLLNDSNLKLSQHSISGFKIPTSQNIGCLDAEKVKFPLTVRSWKQGDRFYPLGMRSQKKLSDFMIDEKIPLNLKRTVLVVESEGNIAWVVGHRIDDRYKITDYTNRVLVITKEKLNV